MQSLKLDSRVTRRSLIAMGSKLGAGLIVGCAFDLPNGARAQTAAKSTALNAWVRIGTDNLVTIVVSQAEIGQGIITTLPAVVAEELGADWPRVHLENSPTDPAYRNPRINWQFTGNSESTMSFYELMRQVGASAREMLISAGAERLRVDPLGCRAENSRVIHTASGRAVSFGEVADAAAKKTPPANPPLKPASEWKLIGKSLPRVEGPSKVDGSAIYGMDFKVPGMVYAAARTSPAFGGKVRSIDRSSIQGFDGVIDVVPIPNGVAVAAKSYWQAKNAVDALNIAFDDGPDPTASSATLTEQYRQAMAADSWLTVHTTGDKTAFQRTFPTTFSQEYESQFLAHAAMEPMNCTASVTADGCDIWAPTQGQEMTQLVLSQALGLPKEKVRVSRTLVGGAFGRRLVADFALQAALVSKAVGHPVKLIWSREEDIQHDLYRPAVVNRLTAGIDEFGKLQTVVHKLASPSILQFVYPTAVTADNDPSCLEGTLETHYQIPNIRVDFKLLKVPVPTSVLRTTGFGPNLFAIESFIDELAHLSGRDPYLFRRNLLGENKRALAVLDTAAQKSNWRDPVPAGHYRGIAFCEAFGTWTAHVVELSMSVNRIKIHRVTAAVDCGTTLDPGISANSIEGGAAWGLSCAMLSEITFANGRTEQHNFNDYEVLRLAQMPPVEVHFIESGARPLGGVGEVGPVTLIPALTNAVFAATGKRIRSLPLSRHGFRLA